MKEIAMILLGVVFVNNFVLSQFLGICPFLGVSKKLDSAVGMSAAVTFVMVLATIVTWPVMHYILLPNGIEYLQTVVFILVIASLVQLVEMILKKHSPALHKSLGVYLPLITTNCAVLGVAIMNIDKEYSYIQAIVNGLGAGLGFLVAMALFAGIRQKIQFNDFPKSFQGIPSVLVSASILSLSFMGFAGVVDGLFK